MRTKSLRPNDSLKTTYFLHNSNLIFLRWSKLAQLLHLIFCKRELSEITALPDVDVVFDQCNEFLYLGYELTVTVFTYISMVFKLYLNSQERAWQRNSYQTSIIVILVKSLPF